MVLKRSSLGPFPGLGIRCQTKGQRNTQIGRGGDATTCAPSGRAALPIGVREHRASSTASQPYREGYGFRDRESDVRGHAHVRSRPRRRSYVTSAGFMHMEHDYRPTGEPFGSSSTTRSLRVGWSKGFPSKLRTRARPRGHRDAPCAGLDYLLMHDCVNVRQAVLDGAIRHGREGDDRADRQAPPGHVLLTSGAIAKSSSRSPS